MASVFLSYDRDDTDRARHFARVLEKAGHSVWWDLHVRGGAQFSKVIEEALKAADVVVVLWSAHSVESAWVRDEAAAGRDTNRLVPVTIDGTEPPLGFRQFQTTDLSKWRGRGAPSELQRLLTDVEAVAGDGSGQGTESKISQRARRRSLFPTRWPVLLSLLLLVAAVAGGLYWIFQPRASAVPIVAIAAADSSAESGRHARDLLAQLGELQSSRPESLELVGADARSNASLVFEVAGASDSRQARANLVLLEGKAGSLLWSKAFERDPAKSGDLSQELGFTAAQLLGCAMEAHEGGRKMMMADTLKLYLKGCAELADPETGSIPTLVHLFRQIVQAAPGFAGAWSKLLMVEVQSVPEVTAEVRGRLERDIAAARKVDPELGAAYAVEAELLPYGAWADRLAILERGLATNPDDTWLLGMRSQVLTAVGRMRDAIEDARKARNIDPLTPATRGGYIFALAQGGQFDAALRELRDAERLWPGSSSVAAAKFSFHLRFGDPRIALQFIRSGTLAADWAKAESFIQARMNPAPANIDQAMKDAEWGYNQDWHVLQHWVQALSILNRETDLLALLMRVPRDQALWVSDVTFRPAAREFWHNPKSLEYARRAGLLQYWQSSGKWPDFCFEPDLPYDCKKEAARLAA